MTGRGAMGLDLNLLVSLDALLHERSVTRAAQRLGLSQPTLSTALARLRRHFDDELLARTGNAYELTALGERLAENTTQALMWTDRVFQTRSEFDPERSDHEFTLVVADCHLPTFGRALTDLVRGHAPHVRLKFQHSTAHVVARASEHLRTVDGIVLPQGVLVDFPSLHLYRDRWVCVASAGTTAEAVEADFAERAWVVAYQPPFSALSPMPSPLAGGARLDVAVITENFLSVPHLVAGTDRLGLMPERIARTHSGAGISIVELPVELGYLVESLWWHPMHERDPAHAWLRRLAAEAGRAVDR
ncbi:LysR family transcriptional regulator [Saccharopolyspora gregorii]|uniref:LysR family transcriptional regulator n=1 Tax=Saccharopolyspora gregorii TaxID=33914 RepID=UPI0021AC2F2A|nr:LysR family transcriptional regulator [Saccharopolyspora gregorii]